MGVAVTVVSPETDCNACRQTKRRFDGLNIPYESVTADDQMIAELQSEGYTAFPVVRVNHGQDDGWSFSGYRHDDIKRLSTLI